MEEIEDEVEVEIVDVVVENFFFVDIEHHFQLFENHHHHDNDHIRLDNILQLLLVELLLLVIFHVQIFHVLLVVQLQVVAVLVDIFLFDDV